MMRSCLLRQFAGDARPILTPTTAAAAAAALFSSDLFSVQYRRYAVATDGDAFPREGPGVSYGLNWVLAGRGIMIKDKAFHNLKASDLHQKGATTAERLHGLPVYVRGSVTGEAVQISKAHFSKLLKQVSTHLSSIANIFVQDGAVSSSEKSNAKVRVISDNPAAALLFSNLLWGTTSRAISHDPCPLTVYVASSISPGICESIGIMSREKDGFLVADIERSSLILCGKGFADTDSVKDTLAAIAAPVISARKGIPLSARLYTTGSSSILVFAPEDLIQTCSELRDINSGVVLTSDGVTPFYYQTKDGGAPNLCKIPSSVVLVSADRSGALPPLAKLTPGQAAYHFLAGYHNGKFVPVYCKGPSPIDPLELSKAFLSWLKDNNNISTFLINVKAGEKPVTGKDLVELIESTLSSSVPQLDVKGDLEGKYKNFISGKFRELPEELTF